VYRVVRLLPGGEMALRVSAVRRLSRQIVVSVDVAQSALHVGVSLCQREASRAVVEVTCRPGGDGVATRASRGRGGESRSNVVRHVAAERLRAVPGGLVATHAVVRAQRVVIVDMAGSAGRRIRRHVRADEGETGRAVIEGSSIPAHCRMAVGAIRGRESRPGGRVHRIVRLLPGGQVAARIAAGVRGDLQIVVIVDVAGSAGNVGVAVRQQETGGAVIERDIRPGRRIVAGGTERCRKGRPGLRVRRIIGLLPGGQVATGVAAIVRPNLQVVIIVDVAGSAGNVGMAVGQQESSRAVIKFRAQPVIKIVAALAVARGKGRPCSRVRRIICLLPVFQVTGLASRRESQEDSDRRRLVAFLAGNGGVGAKQREAILVIFYLLGRDIPAFHGVTLLAIRTHLPAVNVCVAIGAVLSHIGKDRLYVTLDARHFFMHATKRIVRLIVVELRDRPNRAPARRRVTVFARNRERPVRASRRLLVLLGLRLGLGFCRRL
jgi:hypothetical protein